MSERNRHGGFQYIATRIKNRKMKQFSLGLNIVLLAAVIGLYVKVFSGNTTKGTDKAVKKTAAGNSPAISAKSAIAYVELDSLNDKITYIKSRRMQLEAEQRDIETQWQNGYRGLENQKNNFLKRGNSITQQEAEKFQGDLIQQQQAIDGRKQTATQKLSEKSYNFMDDIQKQLKKFLSDYNSSKQYQFIFTTGSGLDFMVYKDSALNITDDVIKGMNEKLNKGK